MTHHTEATETQTAQPTDARSRYLLARHHLDQSQAVLVRMRTFGTEYRMAFTVLELPELAEPTHPRAREELQELKDGMCPWMDDGLFEGARILAAEDLCEYAHREGNIFTGLAVRLSIDGELYDSGWSSIG